MLCCQSVILHIERVQSQIRLLVSCRSVCVCVCACVLWCPVLRVIVVLFTQPFIVLVEHVICWANLQQNTTIHAIDVAYRCSPCTCSV